MFPLEPTQESRLFVSALRAEAKQIDRQTTRVFGPEPHGGHDHGMY